MNSDIRNIFESVLGESSQEKTKVCNSCKEDLPISAFSNANGASYPRSKCRKCEQELTRVRKEIRKNILPPPEDYTCPICQRPESEVKGRGGLSVGSWCCDHNHITHKFRGWLCHDCNRAIGALGDSPDKCIRAAEYLVNNL